MNKARELATKEIVRLLSMFDGYNDSVKETERMLKALTDQEFDKYMQDIRDGKEYLPYIMPTMGKVKLSAERNIAISKKIGVQFHQRLWLTDSATGETYLTPHEYLVVDLPFRRLQQHLKKKISIPDSNKRVDELTGQVTGESKGSKLSPPEVQILYAQGLTQSIRELYTFRGGDETNYRNLVQAIYASGNNSMTAAHDGVSRPKSTEMLGIFLKSAHIDNNI